MNGIDPFGLWDGPGHFDTPYAVGIGLGMSPKEAERMAYLAEYFDINGNYSATGAKPGVVIEIRKYLHSLTGGDAAKLRVYLECMFKSEKLTQDEKSMLLHPYGDSWPHSTRRRNGQEKLDGPLVGHLFRGHKADYISGNQEKYGRYVDSLSSVLPQIQSGLTPNPMIGDELKSMARNLKKPGFLSFFKNEKQDGDEASAIRKISNYSGTFHPEDPGQRAVPSIVSEADAIKIANGLLDKIKNGVAGCCPPK